MTSFPHPRYKSYDRKCHDVNFKRKEDAEAQAMRQAQRWRQEANMGKERMRGTRAPYMTQLLLLQLPVSKHSTPSELLSPNQTTKTINANMRFTLACLAGLVASVVAAPVEKRANTLPPVDSATDESVLQLALYLEHLELALYTGGFENFTDAEYTAAGFPPGFRENVGVIASHEAIHSATISAILEKAGYTPVPPCSYKFPYNSPTSFVDLANMITSVGIGAYLGGAELITDDPMLEVASASIVTVEARHDAYLRAGVGGSPFPTAFDTALTAVFAYNLAQMFIVECPQQLPLPILPKLTLESPMPPPNLQPPTPAGALLMFTFDPSTFFVKVAPGTPLYIGLINMVTNVTYTEVTSCGPGCATIPVPEGAAGAAFAVLTTFSTADALTEDQLSSFGALAGPAEVILS